MPADRLLTSLRADMPDPTLPDRTPEAEDAFLAAWRDEPDPAVLPEVIGAALTHRRPQLAARLVSLLSDTDCEGDPVLSRARSAARLLLVAADPTGPALNAFTAAWTPARSRWMARARRRQRREPGPGVPVLGVSTTPSTRRRTPRRR